MRRIEKKQRIELESIVKKQKQEKLIMKARTEVKERNQQVEKNQVKRQERVKALMVRDDYGSVDLVGDASPPSTAKVLKPLSL